MPSDPSDSSVKLIPQKLIFRKDIKKNFIIKPLDKANHNNQLFGRLKYAKPYKEETIYKSVCGDFLKLANQNVTIINKQNLITKSSITVARYEKDGRVLKEITSENITNLIGKDNYDLVFSTLCSVISQEFKIRGILALLTAPMKSEACCNCPKVSKVMIDIAIQTDESNCDIMLKPQPRRRVKRQHPMPYVVTEIKEKVNRIVINPSDFPSFSTYEVPVKIENLKSEEELSTSKSVLESQTRLADTDFDLDENSMHSTGGLSNISLQTGMTDVLIKEPYSLLSVVEKQTEPNWGNSTLLTVLDGTVVKLPVKPEDDFHIATPEILKYVSPEDRKKLLFYQLYMDWKHCLRRDENGNLAIHTAVINNDVDLVRRQCLVLRSKDLSVDIPASHNMSALQISIKDGSPKCTSMLLHFGADPLAVDDEYYRNCFHLAAEGDPGHLKALVGHCQQNALRILQESEELWKPELESKPKEYQASHLLHQICSMTDNEGETPLMVASKLGRAENVKTLLDAAPRTVNAVMPTSGDTALYRAVSSACHDSSVRGNKSKISENFKQTIEYLIEHDADASIQNHRGFDVNTLLTDFSIGEMSQLIASKLTYINTATRSCEPMMLIKEEDGTVNTVDPKYKRNQKEKTVKNTKNTRKDPVKNTQRGTVKNTQRGTVKNTQKGCVKNTQRDPVTNTPKGRVKDVKNEKFFVSNLSSVDGNVDTIEMNEASVSKNTAANANFSNQAKGSTSDCNKLVILENKVIKNVESSNDYINRFKSFIDCRNRNSSDNLQLKRKLSPEDASSIDIPVRDSAVTHPRVQTLRRISMSSAKIDQNAGKGDVKCDVTNQMARAKMIKIVRPANSKILVIEDKSSSTKE